MGPQPLSQAKAACPEKLGSSSTPGATGSASDKDDGAAPSNLSCVRHGLADDIGPRPGDRMQDASVAISDLAAAAKGFDTKDWPEVTALYAVFDGHGAGARGRHASQFAAEHILDCLISRKAFPSDMEAALTDAVLQIEREYWEAYTISPGATGGTTALVAVIWGNTLYVANTGDCRAVLSRQGTAIKLSRDHRPEDSDEEKRIEDAGGVICYDGRVGGLLAVSRVIGDFQFGERLKGNPAKKTAWPLTAEPEIKRHELSHKDEFIILASDGLWDKYHWNHKNGPIDVARTWLKQHNSPQLCAQQLVADALQRGAWDNVTVIVVCFGEGHSKKRSCSDEEPPKKAGRLSPAVSS